MPSYPPPELREKLESWAARQPKRLTVRQIYEFGAPGTTEVLLEGSRFLRREFTVRIARMAIELERMPEGLSIVPSVDGLKHLYYRSFEEMVDFEPPQDTAGERRFTSAIERIKDRHKNVVQRLAEGILELKKRRPYDIDDNEIRRALDRFHTARIGVRMLIGQHIALHHHQDDHVGIICSVTRPADLIQDTIDQAAQLCRINYGEVPEVHLLGRTDLSFTYIPTHLYYMTFELIKNSMRANVEFSRRGKVPPVRIVFAEGEDDIAIKISDEGGGIPRSGMDRIWTYLYTTAELPDFDDMSGHNGMPPMAGLGYGLPIARLYARYFGGDLQLLSMEGYGTDAYLHLNRLGTHEEMLPG